MPKPDHERSALSVLPTPYTTGNQHLVESVGSLLEKPADEVTVGDMRSVARQKLVSALDCLSGGENADGFAKTDAHNAYKLLRWLNRNA